jgi:hypothetical protein
MKCIPCTDREAAKMLAATKANAKAKKKAKKQKAAREKGRKKAEKNRAAPPPDEKSEVERAQEELARRELAKRNLLAFILRYEPKYMVGWMHKMLAAELMAFSEAVANGESPRLMITMPPRHGKSMQASQYWPAWHLGRYPEHEFINTSYAQSLQMDFSRKIQELVKSHDYHLLFGNLGVTKKNEAIERWSLYDYDNECRTGGGILAAGVGGPITGRGAHVLLIDDPVKNREEAESETVREGAKAWYSSTAYTRLAPGGESSLFKPDGTMTTCLVGYCPKCERLRKSLKQQGNGPKTQTTGASLISLRLLQKMRSTAERERLFIQTHWGTQENQAYAGSTRLGGALSAESAGRRGRVLPEEVHAHVQGQTPIPRHLRRGRPRYLQEGARGLVCLLYSRPR